MLKPKQMKDIILNNIAMIIYLIAVIFATIWIVREVNYAIKNAPTIEDEEMEL